MLTGAQSNGPKAKPSTYSDTANTHTSSLMPSSWAMRASAGAMMLEPKEAARASMPSWKVRKAL